MLDYLETYVQRNCNWHNSYLAFGTCSGYNRQSQGRLWRQWLLGPLTSRRGAIVLGARSLVVNLLEQLGGTEFQNIGGLKEAHYTRT